MASNADKIDRWVAEVRKDAPRYLAAHTYSGTVQIHSARAAKRARLYSYGTHFELARWVDASGDHDGYWMLNGDTYSVSTTRHQNIVRNSVGRTGAPVVILPHSALQAARIDLESIHPMEVTRDRFIPEQRTYTRATLPDWLTYYLDHPSNAAKLTDNGDGTYTHKFRRHV